MARIKIDLPDNFSFTTHIPIRITDINYGGHTGNDAFLSLLHEARMQFLGKHGYTELSFAGVGLIMKDVAIEFKGELFYGDTVSISIAATDFGKAGFDIYYKMQKEENGQAKAIGFAKTGMVCYDYQLKKIVAIPDEARISLQ
ncbi:MAG: thioesterase family protein [Chitinophagaceae bacterium]